MLAAAVPGAFDAWMLLLRDYGTWQLATCSPAIGYAGNGFPLVARIAATIEAVRTLFASEWPSSAAIWLRGARAEAGRLLRNPGSPTPIGASAEAKRRAATARRRSRRRGDAWYRGFVAEAVERFYRRTR